MTPLPDMYGTSTIVEAMKSFVSPEKFLQRNLFGIERYFEGRYLTVDVKGMRRVLSPVVSRWHPGVTVKRPEVQTSVYDVPRLAPVRNTSWEIWISGLLASVHTSLRLCDLCKELAFGTLRRRS